MHHPTYAAKRLSPAPLTAKQLGREHAARCAANADVDQPARGRHRQTDTWTPGHPDLMPSARPDVDELDQPIPFALTAKAGA